MPDAASLDLRAAEELPEEFAGPIAYSHLWLWIAIALVVAVVLYYVLAWWLTRPPRVRTVAAAPVVVVPPNARAEHLARIDAVAAQVDDGTMTPRAGHQELSEVVRSYVETVTTLPARTMALADFRAQAPQELVDAIELMYPPEFAPDDDLAREHFATAVDRARALVGQWAAS